MNKILLSLMVVLLCTFCPCNGFMLTGQLKVRDVLHFTKTGTTSPRLSNRTSTKDIQSLSAKKSNQPNDKEKTGNETKKKLDPLELFILFMTPWRNPNSIFIYMLIILNILGKMNESAPTTTL